MAPRVIGPGPPPATRPAAAFSYAHNAAMPVPPLGPGSAAGLDTRPRPHPRRVLLFVYGTLGRGGVRHHHLAAARFVRPARTAANYRLLRVDPTYPGLVPATSGRGRSIYGELFAVPDTLWPRLDAVEGVDEGLYVCGPVELTTGATGAGPTPAPPVWTYFWNGPTANRPDLGDRWPGA